MDLSNIPEHYHLRVQELMIILRCVKIDWLNEEPHCLSISLSNFLAWTKELLELVGEQNYNAFMLEVECQKVQSTVTPNQTLNNFLEPSTYQQLTQLIEQYQSSPVPLQDQNFDGKVYYSHYLSNRIKLLYQIGKLINILPESETFDNYTKVTQKTQANCNKVCDWLRFNLQIELALNVFEPFIFDYCRYTHLQAKNLREIGVRAGLLAEKVVSLGEKLEDDERRISPTDAKTVINWVKETYGIKLPFPASNQLALEVNFLNKSKNLTEHQGKNKVANAVGVIILSVSLFVFCNQFYSFVSSNQSEFDSGQKNSKPTPSLKAKYPPTKSSN